MTVLDFEVKSRNINVTAKPEMVKNQSFKNAPFQRRHTSRWFTSCVM